MHNNDQCYSTAIHVNVGAITGDRADDFKQEYINAIMWLTELQKSCSKCYNNFMSRKNSSE